MAIIVGTSRGTLDGKGSSGWSSACSLFVCASILALLHSKNFHVVSGACPIEPQRKVETIKKSRKLGPGGRLSVNFSGPFVFSKDGKYLAASFVSQKLPSVVSSADSPFEGAGVVCVWNMEKGTQILKQERKNSMSQAVALSPNNRLVASAWENLIVITDLEDGKERSKVRIPDAQINSLAFSSCGNRLITTSHTCLPFHRLTGSACAWDVETGKLLATIYQGELVHAGALSPDARILAFVDSAEKECIRVYSLDTGMEIFTLRGHRGQVDAIAFSPSGLELASSNRDGDEVIIWSCVTGEQIFRTPHIYSCRGLAWTPDGQFLAIGGGMQDAILVWDLQRKIPIVKLCGYEGGPISFHPSSKLIASGGFSDAIQLYQTPMLSRPVSKKGLVDLPWSAKIDHVEMQILFAKLGESRKEGYDAIWKLVAGRERTVAFLKKSVSPVFADVKIIHCLIAQLDDPDFFAREKAQRDLEGLYASARDEIKKALKASKSVEVNWRLRSILSTCDSPFIRSADTLRGVRSVCILENIGSKDALDVLKALSEGDRRARLTQEAKLAILRMTKGQ